MRGFLGDLQERGLIDGYTLLRNRGSSEKSRLSTFHSDIVFRGNDQFGRLFAAVRSIGIHEGLHGLMIQSVQDFIVEVFEEITPTE